MTIDPWLGLAGLALTVLGALAAHVRSDTKLEQKVNELARRVEKLDGIKSNGL